MPRAPATKSALGAALAAAVFFVGCERAPSPPDAATDAATDAPADVFRDAAVDVARDADPQCTGGPRLEYPAGPYDITDLAVLPDLRFAAGAGPDVALRTYYAPCAAPGELLVIRVLAAWSGPARWAAAHTAALLDHPDRARIRVLDLLALGEDDLPATARDLERWRARYDRAPDALATDPAYRFRTLFFGIRQLPLYVMVDTRTMRLTRVTVNPGPEALRDEVDWALAEIDGRRPAPPTTPTLYDGRFTSDRWDLIRAMTPVPPPPPSPTNAHADDPAAADLGRTLFSDTGLSSDPRVSCASCHVAARGYADGLPVGVGVGTANRNTPTVVTAAYARWLFWDGRADSLWSQALGPIENPAEMASSRLAVAHAVARDQAAAYAAVFGPLPALADAARFPPAGRPGDPAWEAMAAGDQAAVNTVFANVGKALEAYERTLRPPATALDRYAAGDRNALTPAQRDGLALFFDNGCIQCHHGPLLSDQSFHNVAMPTGRPDGAADTGRLDAIATLLASPFRADGAFSDAPTARDDLADLRAVEAQRGQFRTPSLRTVAATGPWGHGGTFASLEAVIVHYARRAEPGAVPGSTGTQDPHLSGFHEDDATVTPMTALHSAFTR